MSETDPDAPTSDPTPAPDEKPPVDTAAELDKWKAMARKHEDRAKANAAAVKELETLKASMMTDQEKAIAEAVAKARADVMGEVGATLVESAFKAAAAGRSLDVDTILDGLDRSRFLADDGKPDTARIAAWVDKLAPASTSEPAKPKDMGQGARRSDGKAPITDRAQLKHMTAQEIEQARMEGRLDQLMRG